ncbi:hypothetical protein JEY40_24640 [Bradyrhizobium japonicum]|uniref:hypothetical protein n=1 Tax=Bradyrhizobium japonicum TaxID=375 RepID=UPI00200F379F|nr:hypothetical protein [Bradyrhizobium japonicum]UQD69207.1 hypothetical protein JEY40_24640 [Bradyrhizobium japonicum]WAX24469.1 hypothetical protein [Bradyrhizobium phage ppBjS10J-1]
MKDSPAPPDPYATAQAQTQSNIATAGANQRVNMVNQSNPYGSLTYSQTGTNSDGTPQFSANTTLSAPFQGILDKSTGAANALLASGAGALGGKGLDLSYNGTAAALDKLNRARLDPQWAQNTDLQESKLAAQGITPGTPAYDNAMRVFNQGKNDAYNSANLADYQTAAQAALNEYNAPVSALGSILGIAKGTNPTFASTPTTNIPGTNISGLIEQNYQQQSQNANAYNGQIAGLAGSLLGAGANFATGGMSGAAGGMGGLFGKGGGVAGTMNYGGQSWPAYS